MDQPSKISNLITLTQGELSNSEEDLTSIQQPTNFVKRDNINRQKFEQQSEDGVQLTNLFKSDEAAEHQHLNEEKILNISQNINIFDQVMEVFLRVLTNVETEIETNYELRQKTLKKLLHLQKVTESKIKKLRDPIEEGKNLKRSKSLNLLSKNFKLFESNMSLCSEENLEISLLYKKFLEIVICPFCSKTQDDTLSFIKHLKDNCLPVFDEDNEKDVPFCEFQIIQNDHFKCNVCPNIVFLNVKHYFFHTKSKKHIVKKHDTKRKYSEFLFCSCCKVLVPNSYIQLNFHLHHSKHTENMRCNKDRKHIDHILINNKNISVVFGQNGISKCIICPSQNLLKSELLHHVKSKFHLTSMKNSRKNKTIFYCEVCSTQVDDIVSHLKGQHKEYERKHNYFKNFQLCFYCGNKMRYLHQLFFHMLFECKSVTECQKGSKISKTNIETDNIF